MHKMIMVPAGYEALYVNTSERTGKRVLLNSADKVLAEWFGPGKFTGNESPVYSYWR